MTGLFHTETPAGLADARHILANPEAYANRPSLVALARLVAMSAAGRIVTQRRLAGRPVPGAPHLRVIEGGRRLRPASPGPEAAA